MDDSPQHTQEITPDGHTIELTAAQLAARPKRKREVTASPFGRRGAANGLVVYIWKNRGWRKYKVKDL